jgi:DinB superfamily
MPDATETIAAAHLTASLKSQYHAALAMLREAIARCPDDLWLDARPKNAFWQIAYHTLFFAHAYLGDRATFQPWAEHQGDNQNEDGIAGPPDPNSKLPLIPKPYTKDQALRYWALVDGMVDHAVGTMDLNRRDSGFPRYQMPKLEHQLVNLRHIQHHTAQLADRLRAACDMNVTWKGKGPAREA